MGLEGWGNWIQNKTDKRCTHPLLWGGWSSFHLEYKVWNPLSNQRYVDMAQHGHFTWHNNVMYGKKLNTIVNHCKKKALWDGFWIQAWRTWLRYGSGCLKCGVHGFGIILVQKKVWLGCKCNKTWMGLICMVWIGRLPSDLFHPSLRVHQIHPVCISLCEG